MPRISTAKERLTDAALTLIWEHSYGATSVDAICEQAGVKKGSFYYFFKSKSDLSVEAMKACWANGKAELDGIFSPVVPPLERLERYFTVAWEKQVEEKRKHGAVLGCPLFTLGCEISTQDKAIQDTIQELLRQYMQYFESAIRDAHAQGLIDAPDAKARAKSLFALFEGTLTQARIQNNTDVLRELYPAALDLLGARKLAASAA